ncbi:hypothetical protein Ddye_013664 [Dipteronia dyeriana]|uniref:Transposase n=1 Tax=Dipteronia dyeriana TaxID=168575 RepID=A0AAD9X6U4_9ROSI|nr:hypothetical protein Ddye_013664 [Dipteronia dyeriana]
MISESINTSRGSVSLKTSDTEDESGGDVDGGKAEIVLGTGGRSYGWVLAWKSNRGTYWHVNAFVNEHTCERNDNYNVKFKRVDAVVIHDLFASKKRDPERIIRLKDIVSEMREHHGIHLSYNKAYKSKEQHFESEDFNSVIKPVICIDATHLKARTMGVLLVAVCKDGNEMIYPLAFGFFKL